VTAKKILNKNKEFKNLCQT